MTSDRHEPVVLEAEDGHRIHAQTYTPEGEVRGVIQVLHGLGEHVGRYTRFARAASDRGFAVVLHDHRGHGGHGETKAYFSENGGWHDLVEDALAVHEHAHATFAGMPVTLLGHSMGSYVAQTFAMDYSDRLAALVLSGSTWPSKFDAIAGNLLARVECWRIGDRRESALLDRLGFGRFNRRFEPARTELDWLTRDEAEVDAYIADPLCGGPYTAGLWRDLTGGLLEIGSDDALNRIRGDLPVLLTAGSDDPVGGEKGVGKLALHYAQTGHNRMKVKLYADARHELLNETNRELAMADWLDWIVQNAQRQ